MTAVYCMPTCFIYRALCAADTAEILIRQKFPAATSTEYLLFCMTRFSPRQFRTSGATVDAKCLVRQQFPAAVGAKHLLCGV